MAVVYNVTVKVEKSIVAEWLQWVVEEHAPQIVNTGCFSKFIVLKLLEYDDEESATYAVQYFANTIDGYNTYTKQFADQFSKKSFDRWGDKFVAFRTVMEVVH